MQVNNQLKQHLDLVFTVEEDYKKRLDQMDTVYTVVDATTANPYVACLYGRDAF